MSELSSGSAALVATLREEGELYTRLLEVTQHEERAIVSGDVRQLTTLIDDKEQLLELLATLETERTTALTAIAAAIGRDVHALSLGELALLVGPRERDALLAAGAALKSEAVALQEANQRNARLLRASRDLVDRWIQYLRVVISGSLTYTPAGTTQGIGGNRVIDQSA